MALKVQVKAVAAYLPGPPIPVDQIDLYGGGLPGLEASRYYSIIRRYAGVEYRHYAIEPKTDRLLEDSQTLAFKAAKLALERANVLAGELDLIITTTTTPPYLRAGLAKDLRVMLGNQSCATYDLWGACTGIQQAITIATAGIRASMFRKALLVGVELASTSGRAENYGPTVDREDLLLRAALGDGAGAMVLVGSDREDVEDGVLYTKTGTEGDKPSAFHRQAGGSTMPLNPAVFAAGLHHWRHDFARMAREGRAYLLEIIKRSLEATSVPVKAVDYIVPAAANFNYFKADEFLAGLSDEQRQQAEWIRQRIFTNFSRVGNIPSAAIYVAVNELYERGVLRPGMLLLLPSIEGATWGWGACLIRWDGT